MMTQVLFFNIFFKKDPHLNAVECTFITEDNNESSKVKNINKNVADGELKYKNYKNVLFNRSYMTHEMKRIQSKDNNIAFSRINKISYLLTKTKKYT